MPVLAGADDEAVVANAPVASFDGGLPTLPITEMAGEALDVDEEGLPILAPELRYGITDLFVDQAPFMIVSEGDVLASYLLPLATDPTDSAAIDTLLAAAAYLQDVYTDVIQHPLVGGEIPGLGLTVNELSARSAADPSGMCSWVMRSRAT